MSNNSIPNYFTRSNSVDLYLTAKFFDDYVLQKEYYPYQFNSQKDNINYGLKNSKGLAIFPKVSSLETYQNINGIQQKNLLFVVDAFTDFKKYYSDLSLSSAMPRSTSLYSRVDAVASTQDIDTVYIAYLNNLYQIFSSVFMSDLKRSSSIKDIYSFSKELIAFFSAISRVTTINRSSFVLSKNCPIDINGLVVYLENNKNYNDVVNKANTYISDPSFEIFLNTARRYGFMVDKNAPWRIVADLASPVMLDYSSRYGLSSVDTVFSNLYHVAHKTDIEVLKNIIVSFWNTWVSSNSTNVSISQQAGCRQLFAEVNSLSEITVNSLESSFRGDWFTRLYLYLKILENRIELDQNKFEIFFQEAIKIDKYFGKDEMLNFVNNKVLELLQRPVVEKSQREVLTNPDDISKLLIQQTPRGLGDTILF